MELENNGNHLVRICISQPGVHGMQPIFLCFLSKKLHFPKKWLEQNVCDLTTLKKMCSLLHRFIDSLGMRRHSLQIQKKIMWPTLFPFPGKGNETTCAFQHLHLTCSHQQNMYFWFLSTSMRQIPSYTFSDLIESKACFSPLARNLVVFQWNNLSWTKIMANQPPPLTYPPRNI